MSDRINRAKSRLSAQEKAIEKNRNISHKLGKLMPDEVVKIPQIGEWSLSENRIEPSSSDLDILSLPVSTGELSPRKNAPPIHTIPDFYPRHLKKPNNVSNTDAPFKLKAPFPVTDPIIHNSQVINTHPNGTTTTDLNAITYSRVKMPQKPLPPLRDEERSMYEMEPSVFPIEIFDDSNYIEFPLEYLLDNPSSVSQFRQKNGEISWKKCRVTSYDIDSGLFTIKWDCNGKAKQVPRFNLRFLVEDETKFEKRIERAKSLAKEAEILYRFLYRIDQMSFEMQPSLSNDHVKKIQLYLKSEQANARAILDPLFAEIRTLFLKINTQLEFEHQLQHNPLIPNRDEFLNVVLNKKTFKQYTPSFKFGGFQEMIKTITDHLPFGCPIVFASIQKIWRVIEEYRRFFLLSKAQTELVKLDSYISTQFQVLSDNGKFFKGSLQESVELIIGQSYDQMEKIPNYKIHDRLIKMVNLCVRIMNSLISSVIDSSLSEFAQCFQFVTNQQTHYFTIDLIFDNNLGICTIPSQSSFIDQVISLISQLEVTINDIPTLSISSVSIPVSNLFFDSSIRNLEKVRKDIEASIDTQYKNLWAFLQKYRHIEKTLCLNSDQYPMVFDPLGTIKLDEYRQKLNEFESVLRILQFDFKDEYRIGIFHLKCSSFKELMEYHTNELKKSLLQHLFSFAHSEIIALQADYDVIVKTIQVVPQTPEELASLKSYVDHINDFADIRFRKLLSIQAKYSFIDEFRFDIANHECKEYYWILSMPNTLIKQIEQSRVMIEGERIRMIRELRSNQRELETETLNLAEIIPDFLSRYQDLEFTVEAVDQASEIRTKLRILLDKQTLFSSHESLFGFEPVPCRILCKLFDDFNPIADLWTIAYDWNQTSASWLETPFPQIKPDILSTYTSQALSRLSTLKHSLENHKSIYEKVLIPLNQSIEKFRQTLPLLSKLRHPGMKTKHWERISVAVGFDAVPSMDVTLQAYFNLNLHKWNSQISEISSIAVQEYSIESALDTMDSELQEKHFVTMQYKDTGHFILMDFEEIVSLVEDQTITTQTFLTSPYIAPVKSRALERLEFLNHCKETLDSWKTCQRTWLYLQPLFTGTTISKQLPDESYSWGLVDKKWASAMTLTHNHSDFMNVMHREKILENFEQCNRLLESITNKLYIYLESKRFLFARFFFLSNDELITLLSNSRNKQEINRSIRKLFEYISTLGFNENSMITQISDEGFETVNLRNPIDTLNHDIEEWMGLLEDEMKGTIKDLIKDALAAYPKKKRDQWVYDFPSQAIIVSSQVIWTQHVTNVIRFQKSRGLVQLQSKLLEQLEQLTFLVRTPLTPSMRRIIACLMILDVHNRDVVSHMIKAGVDDHEDFNWIQQLRYYLEEETIFVRSINNSFEYSYEYTGNTQRLVVTPLTDRCYQTLLSAFKQNMGGAPSGPAGTGKTETVRDCAKALGRPCVVYNCSEDVTPEQMSQFLSGLITSGSWSCFDEFNRINIEVLSVIAQQMRSIQNAALSSTESFMFEKRNLKLNPNAAICITMNPGYQGRTELPDNIKSIFRPCAMMAPDFVYICEILFLSGGFLQARMLSEKLVAFFNLCKKQLSETHHYDWGLRTIKSILYLASEEKLKSPLFEENQLLIDCLSKALYPRLVFNDMSLFKSIIHDIFFLDYSDRGHIDSYNNAIKESCQFLGVSDFSSLVAKCNQLNESIMNNNGVMLVGQTFSCKSTAIKVLQNAYSIISKSGVIKSVDIIAFNPKSITVQELYGLFDPLTMGWKDGLFSKALREYSSSFSSKLKWIVFDGPVNSLWMETLNSLLDENKVLCLPNNERISLPPHVKVFFEVDDLSHASPSTISRCTMVYFDSASLSWGSVFDSWCKSIQKDYPEVSVLMVKLMELYIPKMIQFITSDAHVGVGSNPNILVKNLINIIESFLPILRKPIINTLPESEETKEIDPIDHSVYSSQFNQTASISFGFIEKEQIPLVFERIFLFSLVWSFGAVLTEESRLLFDRFFKDAIDKAGSRYQFPNKYSVFDYYFDIGRLSWMLWCDNTNSPVLNKNQPFENMFIPTNECVSILYLSRLLITNSKNIMLIGPESSKTVVSNTLLSLMNPNAYDIKSIGFSQCTKAKWFLKVLQSCFQKRHGQFIPSKNSRLVLFIDDIGTIEPEFDGSQPSHELLRQYFDYSGWYNTDTLDYESITGMSVLSATKPPGGGVYPIPERFLRHFNYLYIPKHEKSVLGQFLGGVMKLCFVHHPESIINLIRSTTIATLDIYEICCQRLLPIPSQHHYRFGFSNIIRILKGLLLLHPNDQMDDTAFLRLWYHEVCSEYIGRLNKLEDKNWFLSTVNEVFNKSFQLSFDSISTGNVVFSAILDPHRQYKELKEKPERVLDRCRNYLDDYNQDSSKPLKVSMFPEAADHLIMITRSLLLPRGHIMLIGYKSSGKKSLALISLHIMRMESFLIGITPTYTFSDWRNDMKNLMKKCGLKKSPTGLIISDNDIFSNQQLEDISNLLTSSFIPDLFSRDEIELIKNEILISDIVLNQDPIDVFKKHIRNNLHIILTFSPSSTIFQRSLMSFPSIIKETSMEWFRPWSSSSLRSVAFESLSTSITDQSLLKSIVQLCVKVHQSVENASTLFLHEKKRYVAVTPSHFFHLLSLFSQRLNESDKESSAKILEYESGIEKIEITRQQISFLGVQLDRDIPILQSKQKNVEAMIEQLQDKKAEVEIIREQVMKQREIAHADAQAASEANLIAQEKLAEARPILRASQEAVDSIDRDSLVNIKQLKKIHPALRETFEAICIIFGKTPRRVESSVPGVKEDDYWPETLSLLNDVHFVRKIKLFDVEKMSYETVKKLSKYVGANKKQREEKLSHVQSGYQAVANLYNWVCAAFDYWHIYQEIHPRQQEADAAAAKLAIHQKVLAEKEKNLDSLENQLKQLISQVDTEKETVLQLQESVNNTQLKLKRAQQVMQGLSGEVKRWTSTKDDIINSASANIGDTLLVSSFLTYLGPFDPALRSKLLLEWKEFLDTEAIMYSNSFSFVKSFNLESTIRNWIVKGLPNDSHSIENALILSFSKDCIPLLIDPQLNGTKWLCNIEESKLVILHFDESNFLTRLKSCIVSGIPVLISNVGVHIDPLIDPILSKDYRIEGGKKKIIIGGELIDYSPHFRLFLTTKYPNPHYTPELCSQVLLLNFTTTHTALVDLLMNNLLEVERDDLEKKRIQIYENNALYMKKLKDIETEILQIVSNTSNDILQDDHAINTLANAQRTSSMIEQQIAISKKTENLISQFRTRFASVVDRAALLYFCVADMSCVDPMYQFSLNEFIVLFKSAIHKADHPQDTLLLINSFNTSIALEVYRNISCSLFAKDRLLFSFMISMRILVSEGMISSTEISFLLAPFPTSAEKTVEWVSDDVWPFVCSLSSISPSFIPIIEHMKVATDQWNTFMASLHPEMEKMPLHSTLSPFQRLILLRVFHLHRMREGIAMFIQQTIGKDYLIPPPMNLKKLYENTTPLSPIVFIVSPGTDPHDEVSSLADSLELSRYLKVYSLGRGRGAGAEELIIESASTGFWVLLQNCHLSLSWMTRLERIIDQFDHKTIHPRFRLFLVSTSSNEFPIGILYSSNKLVYEIPRGIRDSMLRVLGSLDADHYNIDSSNVERQMVFHLAFFHSVVLERLHYGSLGWNRKYDFNYSDFVISKKHLLSFLTEAPPGFIPYEAISHVIGELNYGGRVTDQWDRRLLKSLLKRYLSEDIQSMNFSLALNYTIPQFSSPLDKVESLVSSWPVENESIDVGLSTNAGTIISQTEALGVFSSILEIQPSLASIIKPSNDDELAITLIETIIQSIPQLFVLNGFNKKFDNSEPINVTLNHELNKFNILLTIIKETMTTLLSALQGRVLYDEQMRLLCKSILSNRIPKEWLPNSYPSTYSLSVYLQDLKTRVSFFDNWLRNGRPTVFRLGAFFHPEEFLSSIMQYYSRKHNVTYDHLVWSSSILDFVSPGDITSHPNDGVYIDGVIIEGAKWDSSKKHLAECSQVEIASPLPIIHLIPTDRKPTTEMTYECPLYWTRQRSLKCLETENAIMTLYLPTRNDSDTWIQRSVAAFIT